MTTPKRRGTGERQQVRQEISELVHQVNAQGIVTNANMYVHAADQQSPRRALHLGAQRVVTFLPRGFLFRPVTERMRRCRDRREVVTSCDVDDAAS